MTVKAELMNKIKQHFELNIYESKVWVALLNKGIATASEIADISEVPRSRTYDVLESLEKKGFAIEKLGKPVKFIAVKPSVVIERLKNDLMNEAEEKTSTLAELKNTEDFKQIELLYKQGIQPINTEDLSGTVKGRANVHSHIKDIVGKATKNVVIATNSDVLKKDLKVLGPIFENLSKKNVKVKIVVNGNEEEIKEAAKGIKADIRHTDMNARFCIVDEKELLFMLNNSQSNHEEAGIWITSPYFANALSTLFDLAWKK